MTACTEYETLLHGLVDGELDAAHTLACEQHVARCHACRLALDDIKALRATLRAASVSYPTPERLRARIDAALYAPPRGPAAVSRRRAAIGPGRRWTWPAAAAAAAAAMVVVLSFVLAPASPNGVATEVIAGHIRSLQANHLVDVVASDRHVVKPWFAGRVDFSPPVVDLAAQGFELVGGRLDYLQGHAVAALVYHRRAHVINVFVWPWTGSPMAVAALERSGFHLLQWRALGMNFWAISDLNADELHLFEQELMARAAS